MLRNHLLNESNGSPNKVFNNINTHQEDNDPWYNSGSSESPDNSNNASPSNRGGFGGNYNNNYNNTDNNNMMNSGIDDDYDNELPLLEELGIRFEHILSKTQAVIHPLKELDSNILDDADLAGPLCFCLLLGSCLLLSGKVHFGYIYGFSVFGCAGLYMVLNLLHPGNGLDFWRTCSVLGYCLIPVIALAGLNILFNLQGFLGSILSLVAIVWSTHASTRLFHAKLGLSDQYWLVAYPVMLLYSCFVLITIF